MKRKRKRERNILRTRMTTVEFFGYSQRKRIKSEVDFIESVKESKKNFPHEQLAAISLIERKENDKSNLT